MQLTTLDDTTMSELRTLVANVLDLDEQTVTDNAHFIDDLGVDSLMALEVMVALEKHYQIKLSEKELKQITCLRNVYQLLKAKQAQDAQTS